MTDPFILQLIRRRDCKHVNRSRNSRVVWVCKDCGTSFEDAGDGRQTWISSERAAELRARYG